jgi:ATP-dependent helicase/nuclease subunit B
MPARLHIIAAPHPAAATASLLARCRQIDGPTLWLTPSRRAALALGPQLLAYTEAQVLTLQHFADEIVSSRVPTALPLSHTQRRLLIEDVLATLHRRGALIYYQRHFDTRSLVDLVIGLVTELKQIAITVEQFAAAAGNDRQRDCAAIYRAYQERLRGSNLFDQEGRMWSAAELVGEMGPDAGQTFKAVFVAGFAEFTALQRQLLLALAEGVQAMWISLPDQPADERCDLFRPSREAAAGFAGRARVVQARPAVPCEIPVGLVHLGRQLFRARHRMERSAEADGIQCIEAPGPVGEARLVAREIRLLLDRGVKPDAILVSLRDLAGSAELLREVFTEYQIPIDIEGAEPLHRNPAIAMLLRTLRLQDEDWPFAATTAVLRNGYFRPNWPEAVADCEIAQHSEALLRLLGKPRGRDAYLKAVRHWAEKVHPGWEDEQAEESRRQKTHELAVRCLPFLQRFFQAWDDAPARASPEQMISWLRSFSDSLGIRRVAFEDPRDAEAWRRLEAELTEWSRHQQGPQLIERGQFLRKLGSIAAEAGQARTPRGLGRVRVLSAELAAALEIDYLFLMGLGERSFPQLAAPGSLLDEHHRQALRERGLPSSAAEDRLPGEMLLFYRLVTAPRRGLVLSYTAVDDRGQELLPSSFLAAVRDCFSAQAIPELRRSMLIEGLDKDPPLAPAERRVWAARHGDPLQRFHNRDFTRYDGWLRDSALVGDLQSRFGPSCILSPTALENYVACPFKFFLRHVLGLQPLEEPDDQIESTDRGLAFHRALSRLHIHLKKTGVDQPVDEVEPAFLQQLDLAIREQASRASLAGEVLWGLEGERLKRLSKGYHRHWGKFVEPWRARGVQPRPEFFEVSFGLPAAEGETPRDPLIIRMDGVEVRISGRIDRVDVAELPDGQGLGFWVIDYKTGRAANYTSSDLAEFSKLQLTLYALATEEVLLRDRKARPLGLAYWLVVDGGAKLALPGDSRKALAWFDETQSWPKLREVLERWIVQLVSGIRQGEFPLQPRSSDCTALCDYSQICRISQARSTVESKTWQLPLPTVS